jgi:hypothetical protein
VCAEKGVMDSPYKLAVLDLDVFLTFQGSDGLSVGHGQSVLDLGQCVQASWTARDAPTASFLNDGQSKNGSRTIRESC